MEIADLAVLAGVATIAALLVYGRRLRARQSGGAGTVRFYGYRRYRFAVLGTSIYRSSLERLCGVHIAAWHGRKLEAVLVPEYGHLDRDDAVRVEIDGRTVGYLPGDAAFECCRRLRANRNVLARGQCKAKITVPSPHKKRPYSEDFAVHLDLPRKR